MKSRSKTSAWLAVVAVFLLALVWLAREKPHDLQGEGLPHEPFSAKEEKRRREPPLSAGMHFQEQEARESGKEAVVIEEEPPEERGNVRIRVLNVGTLHPVRLQIRSHWKECIVSGFRMRPGTEETIRLDPGMYTVFYSPWDCFDDKEPSIAGWRSFTVTQDSGGAVVVIPSPGLEAMVDARDANDRSPVRGASYQVLAPVGVEEYVLLDKLTLPGSSSEVVRVIGLCSGYTIRVHAPRYRPCDFRVDGRGDAVIEANMYLRRAVEVPREDGVYFGGGSIGLNPAKVRAITAFRWIREYKKIESSRLEEDDPLYWTLLLSSNRKFLRAVEEVAHERGYDTVRETREGIADDIPDVTAEVVKTLREMR